MEHVVQGFSGFSRVFQNWWCIILYDLLLHIKFTFYINLGSILRTNFVSMSRQWFHYSSNITIIYSRYFDKVISISPTLHQEKINFTTCLNRDFFNFIPNVHFVVCWFATSFKWLFCDKSKSFVNKLRFRPLRWNGNFSKAKVAPKPSHHNFSLKCHKTI